MGCVQIVGYGGCYVVVIVVLLCGLLCGGCYCGVVRPATEIASGNSLHGVFEHLTPQLSFLLIVV